MGGEGEEEEASAETTPVAVRRLIELKGWNVSYAGTACSCQPRFGIVEGGAGPEMGGGAGGLGHPRCNAFEMK